MWFSAWGLLSLIGIAMVVALDISAALPSFFCFLLSLTLLFAPDVGTFRVYATTQSGAMPIARWPSTQQLSSYMK
jgi:hypothetical protein